MWADLELEAAMAGVEGHHEDPLLQAAAGGGGGGGGGGDAVAAKASAVRRQGKLEPQDGGGGGPGRSARLGFEECGAGGGAFDFSKLLSNKKLLRRAQRVQEVPSSADDVHASRGNGSKASTSARDAGSTLDTDAQLAGPAADDGREASEAPLQSEEASTSSAGARAQAGVRRGRGLPSRKSASDALGWTAAAGGRLPARKSEGSMEDPRGGGGPSLLLSIGRSPSASPRSDRPPDVLHSSERAAVAEQRLAWSPQAAALGSEASLASTLGPTIWSNGGSSAKPTTGKSMAALDQTRPADADRDGAAVAEGLVQAIAGPRRSTVAEDCEVWPTVAKVSSLQGSDDELAGGATGPCWPQGVSLVHRRLQVQPSGGKEVMASLPWGRRPRSNADGGTRAWTSERPAVLSDPLAKGLPQMSLAHGRARASLSRGARSGPAQKAGSFSALAGRGHGKDSDVHHGASGGQLGRLPGRVMVAMRHHVEVQVTAAPDSERHTQAAASGKGGRPRPDNGGCAKGSSWQANAGGLRSVAYIGDAPQAAAGKQASGRASDNDLAAILAEHNRKFRSAPQYEPRLHSTKDVREWEEMSGRKFYTLDPAEREQANREIAIMKRPDSRLT
eukprot:SM000008S22249  [mRNA]  locus=s8:644688:647895:- [translate_table: standard]